MEPISSSIGFMGDHGLQFSTKAFSSSSSPSPSPPHTVVREQPTTTAQLESRAASNGPVTTDDPVLISSAQVVRPIGATSALVGSSSSAKTSSANSSGSVRYRECLRNHAASVGGHVIDGCGEFMPRAEPDALKCSVCGCHRSFHRKEVDGQSSIIAPPPYYFHQFSNGSGGHRTNNGTPPTPLLALPPPIFRSNQIPYNPIPVTAFSGGAVGGTTTESSSEDLDARESKQHSQRQRQQSERGFVQVLPPPPSVLSRKRFRTKFTSEQKEKMLGFAESVGWRMHRKDEVAVERFCAEIGVSRQVFKVWMHNNKHISSSSTQRLAAEVTGTREEVHVVKQDFRDQSQDQTTI